MAHLPKFVGRHHCKVRLTLKVVSEPLVKSGTYKRRWLHWVWFLYLFWGAYLGRLSPGEGLTMRQKPFSDALCHILPATRTLVLRVQVPGWDPWAGIPGERSRHLRQGSPPAWRKGISSRDGESQTWWRSCKCSFQWEETVGPLLHTALSTNSQVKLNHWWSTEHRPGRFFFLEEVLAQVPGPLSETCTANTHTKSLGICSS